MKRRSSYVNRNVSLDRYKFNEIIKEIKLFDELDWKQIAKDACLVSKSGADCCVMWHSTLNENYYKNWSKEELICITNLAEKHRGMRGDIVAQELDSHRRPISCLQIWQRSLNPLLASHQWTLNEDRKLLNAISEYGIKSWREISKKLFLSRTPRQCFERFLKLQRTSQDKIDSFEARLNLKGLIKNQNNNKFKHKN
jgi:hypothetical protein